MNMMLKMAFVKTNRITEWVRLINKQIVK